MEWRREVAAVIQAFDTALGRPPFPQDPPADLLGKVTAVLVTLRKVVDAGKLKSLEGLAEATTTLPILCASLREGSANRRPSPALYRPLLLAVGLASTLSTYPISNIVADAKAVLGASFYDDALAAAPPTAAASTADVEANEAALFTFMNATRSLTQEDVRRFLRLPPLLHSSPFNASSKGKNAPKQKNPSKAAPSSSTGKGDAKTAGKPAAQPEVSRAMLDAMIDAAMPEECRSVFESFFDNTQKFLDVVGRDGDLASRILAVYGARIVPKLKPSSLLPCLNAALLDYFIDVVAASLEVGSATLLVSKELREIPRKMWDRERVLELASAAATRAVRADAGEAIASLVVYTFLYLVFCDLDGCHRDGEAAPCAECDEDRLLLCGVGKALQAVLLVEGKAKNKLTSSSSSVSRVYEQTNTGILVVPVAEVPKWLDALFTFAQNFLARQAAASLLSPSAMPLTEEGMLQPALTTLNGILRGLLRSPPRPERSTAAPAAVSTQKNAPGKSKGKQGKQQGGDKSAIAADASKRMAEVSSSPPLAFSELLSSCCGIFLLSSVLWSSRCLADTVSAAPTSSPATAQDALPALVLDAYTYLLQHQPQRLSAALWRNGLSLLTFHLWVSRRRVECGMTELNASTPSSAATMSLLPSLVHLDQHVTVLRAATMSTDSTLWLAPLVLPLRKDLDALQTAAVTTLFAGDVELWLAVVQAAVNAPNAVTTASAVSSLNAHLFPAPAAVVLGCLCAVLEEAVLQRLADAVVNVAPSRRAVMVASLTAMHSADWATLPAIESHLLQTPVSTAVSQGGLRRLLNVIAILEAGHHAMQHAAAADAKEAARRAMQAQLDEAHQLSAAHRVFLAEAQSKQAAKAAKQEELQQEAARRRAERVERQREDAAARARKRQNALATLREKAGQTRAQREAARRARFAAYQQRIDSAYRVSAFLEHLNLTPARVMATRDALRGVLDTITPDDLLEFLVTGEAKVPRDMLEEEDEHEEEAQSMNVVEEKQMETHKALPPDMRTHTGERRDFWAEIMDHAEDAVEPVAPQRAPTATAVQPPALSTRKYSFHRRLAPLLDLFFYEDGDEFGKVPEVMPSLHLRLAASVWPPARTQPLGFPNVREAFEGMQQRGLVQIQGGVVQLTLLGFRYHFPFHDAEGMLEVYLREARERVRAAVEARHGGADVRPVEETGVEEEETDEEEEEEEESSDGDRLLPEVEFGT